MACPEHEEMKLLLVCMNCRQGICALCLDQDNLHQVHAKISFDAASKNLIKQFVDAVENNSKLQEDLDELSKQRQTEQEIADKTKQDILNRYDEMKKALEEVKDTLLAKHENHRENLFRDLDSVIQRGNEHLQKVGDYQNNVETLKALTIKKEIVEEAFKMAVPDVIHIPRVSGLTFKQSGNTDTMATMFGELVEQDLSGN